MSDFLKKIRKEKEEQIKHLYSVNGGIEHFKSIIKKNQEATPTVNTQTFYKALAKPGLNLIAELKKASPSKGLINPNFEPESLARQYQELGASALSVLTEETYFQGSIHYLPMAKAATQLPLLRKDFISDPIELYEAAAFKADAALLIVAMLSKAECQDLLDTAKDIGLDILLEVHTAGEMETALSFKNVSVIGINNRNLHTLEVDISTATIIKNTYKIALQEKNILCVAESGYTTAEQMKTLEQNGFNAVLIGEGIVTHPQLLAFWKVA